jgi:hypothetical protein
MEGKGGGTEGGWIREERRQKVKERKDKRG